MNIFVLLFIFGLIRVIESTKFTTNNNRPANPLWESTWTDKLKHDLLLHYDKFARPKQHSKNTTIEVKLHLLHIEMDEKKSFMTLHSYTYMMWEDEKLKWNASDYGGITKLLLADHEIWQPDIFPYNSATGSKLDFYGNVNLVVENNGTVIWVPPTVIQFFCEMDFIKWPYDTQKCKITMGSWTHDGEGIDLVSPNDKKTNQEGLDDFFQNAEWAFIEIYTDRSQVYYECCKEPYVNIKFVITVKRRSTMYTPFIIIPAVVIIVTTLTIYWLPPTSNDKLTLAGTAIVIALLILFYLVEKMPVKTGYIPFVVSFYSKCLYLVSFAIVLAVVTKNIAQNSGDTPLPWILKKNLSGWLGKYLLIRQSEQNLSRAEEMQGSQLVLSEQGRHICESNAKSHQKDWVMLAVALDRIFFIFYCCAFGILVMIYSV